VIVELYPAALRHLSAARDLSGAIAQQWSDLLDGGFTETEVVTNHDGTGRITARVEWPTGLREALTELFRGCTSELWASLDSLVVESVQMFSALRRTRFPDRPRFFPMADSLEGFQALLAESCLDGILQRQFSMILDCQPFRTTPNDPYVNNFRAGLRQLLDWTTRLEEGSMLGAWVTPVEPRLRVSAPGKVVDLNVLTPGELTGEGRRALAPSTVEVVYRYVVAVFRAAVADRVIVASPCVDVRLPKGKPRRVEPMSTEAVGGLVTRSRRATGRWWCWVPGRAPAG